MKKRNRSQFSMYDKPQEESPIPNFYSSQYEFGKLNTARLQSSQRYQRPVDANHVKEIIRNFDPLYLDEILVSCRDGVYYVIDGQNRIAAFKEMNGGQDCMVNCKIYHNLTYEQEADMFHYQDSNRKKLRFGDTVRAKIESGSDEDINAIGGILSSYHIRWAFNGVGARGNFTVSASQTLIECYKELGCYHFESMVRLMAHTWRGSKAAMTAPFMKGLAEFVKLYAKEGDEDTFVRKVGAHTPAEIKALADGQSKAIGVGTRYAIVFYQKYNNRTTESSRLPYKF